MSENVFDVSRVIVDTYKEKQKGLSQKRAEQIRDLKKNVKDGSPLYKQKIKEINDSYETDIQKERVSAKNLIDAEIGGIVEHEKSQCSPIIGESTAKTLKNLKILEEMPLTKFEVENFKTVFGGKDYWIDKKINLLAEKNGITFDSPISTIDERINVMNELGKTMYSFLDNYNGATPNYQLENSISSRAFLELEERFANGVSDNSLNNEQVAARAVMRVKSGNNTLEQAVMLSNAMTNASPEVQNYIMYELKSDGISETVLKLSDYSLKRKVLEFDTYGFEHAKDIVSAVKGESKEKGSAIIDAELQKGNSFLVQMLKEEMIAGNKEITQACKLSDISVDDETNSEA